MDAIRCSGMGRTCRFVVELGDDGMGMRRCSCGNVIHERELCQVGGCCREAVVSTERLNLCGLHLEIRRQGIKNGGTTPRRPIRQAQDKPLLRGKKQGAGKRKEKAGVL